MKRDVPIAIALILACVGACNRIPDSGIELEYRISIPQADRSALESVAQRRLDLLKIAAPRVVVEADRVVVRLPGATPETAMRAKRILRNAGRLEFCAAAPIDVQRKFNEDKIVPEGYQVVRHSDPGRGEYEAYGAQVLIQKESVIENRHVASAEPRQQLTQGGSRWVTSFEMTKEGATLFDAAARKLYERRPPGLLAILIDGVVKSMPAIMSPEFKGQAQISGARDEEEASDVAILLKSGALPVPLGDPASEKPYAPK